MQMMNKSLQPSDIDKPKHLATLPPEIRGELINELPQKERPAVVEELVEYAMTNGLTDPVQIRRWLGLSNYPVPAIKAAKDRVMTRWIDETADVYSYARDQRAAQITKAYNEIREIESLYQEAKNTGDKVRVKKLLLEWMQYISKLTFVEKMVEASEPDLQIVVNSGVEEKKSSIEIGAIKDDGED